MIIGNEVGSIVKSLKTLFPDIKIGSIDILGNIEMRKFSDYSFSVEKQVEDKTIGRVFQRPVIDYLSELGLIMSEENEFDYLVPVYPIDKNFDIIHKIDLLTFPNTNSVSSNKYLNPFDLIEKYLKDNQDQSLEQEFSNVVKKEYQGKRIFITTDGDYFANISEKVEILKIKSEKGLWVPIGNIYASLYFIQSSQLRKLGTMRLESPLNKSFNYNDLDKNSFISLNNHEIKMLIPFENLREKICLESRCEGIITIFFTLTEDSNLIPLNLSNSLSCHFDLYINNIIQLKHNIQFRKMFENLQNIDMMNIDCYRIPYYCKNQIKVPFIESDVATHRNIPKVLSNPEYPVCCLKKDR